MDIVVRATVIFFFLFILLRMIGARELGELSPFELIVTIMLGDLVQQAITQNDFSLTGAVIAVSTIVFWSVMLSWISYYSPGAQKLLEGEPRVIIKDGEFLAASARPLRVTRREVESAMRGDGIAAISDIAWGVLEPNGRLTFIKKPERSGEV